MFIGELGPGGRREAVAPANFVDLAGQSRAFERMAIHRGARFILTGRSVPESVIGANVSSAFFSVLRVQPQQGRAFLPEDERPRRPACGHAQPQPAGCDYFSQDPAIVGRAITLDGVDHVVVGVLPPGFSLWDTDVWVAGFDPALMNSRVRAQHGRASGALPTASRSMQARAELDTSDAGWPWRIPATNAGWTFRTHAAAGSLARRVSPDIADPARRAWPWSC